MSKPRRLSAAFGTAVALIASVAIAGAAAPRQHAEHDIRRLLMTRRDDDAARRLSYSLARGSMAELAADLRARPLELNPGELLSATARKSAALHVVVDDVDVKAKLSKFGEPFVPRGVDYDSDRGLLAIAAVSQVLIMEVTTGTVTSLLSPTPERQRFGFANDVLFDGSGGLVIADQGDDPTGRLPRDGALWRYDLESGDFVALGSRRKLSNPKLLARHVDGTIYFVDGEAGPRITPALSFRYDAVFRLVGENLDKAKRFYNGAGIQATAFDIASDSRFWFGNVAEIVTLRQGELSVPCSLPPPFRFVTGLVVVDDDTVFILDGAPVVGGKRKLYEVDRACVATAKLVGGKLTGARGLARVAVAPQ